MPNEATLLIGNQLGLVDNAIRVRDWNTAVYMLYCLGGMVTMLEVIYGYNTAETAPLRTVYQAKWNEATALQAEDTRRHQLRDAC